MIGYYISLYILYAVAVLVRVAFITLMEQKILGEIQVRVGPSYVGVYGLLQSFADAVKLLNKERVKLWQINYRGYLVCPVISLVLRLGVWLRLPLVRGGLMFKLRILYFICVSGLRTYPIILSGWVSNCKYAMLGSLRRVAQIISYEIRLRFLLVSFIFFFFRLRLDFFMKKDEFVLNLVYFFPLSLIWLVCILAETNRTPYDFSERESELVSGYNTEFRSRGFTLLFIAEYRRIIFMSFLFVYVFLSS